MKPPHQASEPEFLEALAVALVLLVLHHIAKRYGWYQWLLRELHRAFQASTYLKGAPAWCARHPIAFVLGLLVAVAQAFRVFGPMGERCFGDLFAGSMLAFVLEKVRQAVVRIPAWFWGVCVSLFLLLVAYTSLQLPLLPLILVLLAVPSWLAHWARRTARWKLAFVVAAHFQLGGGSPVERGLRAAFAILRTCPEQWAAAGPWLVANLPEGGAEGAQLLGRGMLLAERGDIAGAQRWFECVLEVPEAGCPLDVRQRAAAWLCAAAAAEGRWSDIEGILAQVALSPELVLWREIEAHLRSGAALPKPAAPLAPRWPSRSDRLLQRLQGWLAQRPAYVPATEMEGPPAVAEATEGSRGQGGGSPAKGLSKELLASWAPAPPPSPARAVDGEGYPLALKEALVQHLQLQQRALASVQAYEVAELARAWDRVEERVAVSSLDGTRKEALRKLWVQVEQDLVALVQACQLHIDALRGGGGRSVGARVAREVCQQVAQELAAQAHEHHLLLDRASSSGAGPLELWHASRVLRNACQRAVRILGPELPLSVWNRVVEALAQHVEQVSELQGEAICAWLEAERRRCFGEPPLSEEKQPPAQAARSSREGSRSWLWWALLLILLRACAALG